MAFCNYQVRRSGRVDALRRGAVDREELDVMRASGETARKRRAAVIILALILAPAAAAAIVAGAFQGKNDRAGGVGKPATERELPRAREQANGKGHQSTRASNEEVSPSSLRGRKVAADQPAASVGVFDTGTSLPVPLLVHALTSKAGWIRVPEANTAHQFKGDAILANDRVMVVCRQGSRGAELFGYGVQGPDLRAVLAPVAAKSAARLGPVAIVENSAGESALDAAFRMPDGQQAVVRFGLQAGEAFVKTTARRGVERLRVEAPGRFAVLPDFFADDIVVDATELPGARAELPSENFFLHMVHGGEAIVMAVWDQREEEVEVALAGRDRARIIEASEIPYGAKGAVYVALLEGPGIWHSHEVEKADAGQVIGLGWKTPFSAQWRVDFREDGGLTDSWEMLVEKPDGSYLKLDWFGQPDADGTPDWLKSGRNRWTAVLGGFQYPCWIDKEGQGYLQPRAEVGRFQGPALVYPINRTAATPLLALTFVDIMRATLGVGPCEYVLDVEGQKKRMEGVPTCTTRQKLNAIYSNKEQKQKRAEVEEALEDVLAFVQHIRTRIEAYAAWGHEMLAYLNQEQKARPELAGFLQEMETLARSIDAAVANRKRVIQTPQYAAELVEEFRTTLLGCEDDDALDRCRKITAALVEIDCSQDRLVGECREAVKILRQRSALAMVTDPRTAPVALEIRRRTQAVLRNPTSFEAPRH